MSIVIEFPWEAQQPSWGRTLHVVDVENLAGTASLQEASVAEVQAAYVSAAGVGPTDHVVIATAHHGAPGAWFGWQGEPRRLVKSGPDGADRKLIDVLVNENVAVRYDRVVIGSGDAIFSEAAARLQAAGVTVSVVTRPESISKRLAFAVRDVRLLPPLAQQGGAAAAGEPA